MFLVGVGFFLLFFILPVSIYLTSLICCLSHWRRRRADWYMAGLGAIGTGVLMALFYAGGLAHRLDGLTLCMSLLSTVIALLPAVFTMRHFRERFTDEQQLPGVRRLIGVVLAIVGNFVLIIAIILWLRVPQGVVENDALTAIAVTRAVQCFLAGVFLSFIGFFLSQRRFSW